MEVALLGLMDNGPLLISSLIEYAGKFHGKTELVSRSFSGKIERTNYSETLTRSKKLAQSLKKLGVKKGDIIGTLAWSNIRHFELY